MADDEITKAVDAERARCAAIVQAARAGNIDGDFRTIIHFIEDGASIDEIKARSHSWQE